MVKILCFGCGEEYKIGEKKGNKSFLRHDCKLYEELYQSKKVVIITLIE